MTTSTTAVRTAPVFDRHDTGTPEDRWRTSGIGEQAGPLDLDGIDRAVVLSAHPDDETLGAGGLLARLHARGLPIQVIVATDGEGSHPGSPTHAPQRLAQLRRAELDRALGRLAPTATVRRLGLPDGTLAIHHDRLVAAVHEAMGPSAPSTLLLTPWRDDAHPDHEAVARAGEQAAAATGARVLQFPIWAWHWADPDDARLHGSRLAVLALSEEEQAAKRDAIADHRSQVTALGPDPADQPVLHEAFLAHFRRPFEIFLPIERSLTTGYFEALYEVKDDPWGLGANWYEQRKRAITEAALTRPRFRSAFEPGCAIGLLTELLAPRCDALLAADLADSAVAATRRRMADQPHVQVRRIAVPAQWPSERFDLIVLSEMGYYCDRTDLSRLIRRTVGSLEPDGVVLACHWRHPPLGYPLTGDQVHAALIAESGLDVIVSHLEEDFRLDVLAPPGTPSVARWAGVLA